MKSHSWSTRSYKAGSTNPLANYQAYHCSWLFNTGMGSTSRYIGGMQVRIPAYGDANRKVKLIGYALGNNLLFRHEQRVRAKQFSTRRLLVCIRFF